MERKFESEIALGISEGNRCRSSNKIGVLTAVVISCALLLGSAAFLLPAMSSAEEGKVVSVDYVGAMDYLVYDYDSDCLIHYNDFKGPYDVKKSMDLRAMVYPPSVNAPGKYVKFTYTTSVHLDVVENLDLDETVALGNLEIPYAPSGVPVGDVLITWSMTVDGVTWGSTSVITDSSGTPVLAPAPGSASYDGSILTATVALPVLLEGAYIMVPDIDGILIPTLLPDAYVVEDDVKIQIHFKVATPSVGDVVDYISDILPAEDAFPGFPDSTDLPVAVITAVDPVDLRVQMGGTVTLSASASESADRYEWYLDGVQLDTVVETLSYTFDDEMMPGEYTFVLVVSTLEGLKDIAEVTVSVYDGEPPVAVISCTETFLEDGSISVVFGGSGSTDNIAVVSYVWILVELDGCKVWGFEASMTYLFVYPGVYTVTLTVADGAGNTGSDTLTYTVPEPPAEGEATA